MGSLPRGLMDSIREDPQTHIHPLELEWNDTSKGGFPGNPSGRGIPGKWYCVHITGHLLILLPCVSIIHQLAICPLQPPIPTPPCPFVSSFRSCIQPPSSHPSSHLPIY